MPGGLSKYEFAGLLRGRTGSSNAGTCATAIYRGSYLGRAPFDEPSVLAFALNDVFVPPLQKAFAEVVGFHRPPKACSYRDAVVSIRKQYLGHVRRPHLLA